MIFAAAAPDFDAIQLAAWMGIAAFLVTLANGLFRLAGNVKGRPLPAEVQADAAARYQPKGDYATRGDLVALEARITAMSTASDVSRHELRSHIDVSVAKLGERLDSLREDIGEAEHRLNQTGEQRAIESHKRHNQILAAVSELRGAFDQANR